MDNPEWQSDEQLRHLSTAELVRHALDEAKLLVKAEVLAAKRELKEELVAAKRAGILLGASAVLALCGLAALFVALGIALPGAPGWGVAIVAVLLLAIAGGLAFYGVKRVPKKPMERTVDRIKTDIAVTREQFA